jgi:hypothetical protein
MARIGCLPGSINYRSEPEENRMKSASIGPMLGRSARGVHDCSAVAARHSPSQFLGSDDRDMVNMDGAPSSECGD